MAQNPLKKYTWEISDNPEHPAGMAMLYATGMSDKKMKQPFVGIASCGYESNPCNMHLNPWVPWGCAIPLCPERLLQIPSSPLY